MGATDVRTEIEENSVKSGRALCLFRAVFLAYLLLCIKTMCILRSLYLHLFSFLSSGGMNIVAVLSYNKQLYI